MNALRLVLGPADRTDLRVDEASLLDVPGAGAYDVDVVELARAACGVGPAWVLTCDCGIPECAGIGGPVAVQPRADAVTWTLPPPLRRTVSFDAEALRSEVRTALEAAHALPLEAVADRTLVAQQTVRPWHEALTLALAQMDAPTPTPYQGD